MIAIDDRIAITTGLFLSFVLGIACASLPVDKKRETVMRAQARHA